MRGSLMRRSRLPGIAFSMLFAVGYPAVNAQEPAPRGVLPEVGPIQKSITMNGYFAPGEVREISVELEAGTPLRVQKCVEHGASVRKGDVLIEFDAKDAKEQLEQDEFALALQKLALEEAEREHRIAQLKLPLDVEAAELAKRRSDEDFAFFMEHEFPMSQRLTEGSLKSSRDYRDYTAEELRQLEKMYKADDLTEESEEIVLRRAKDDLARSDLSLEQAELSHRKSTTFSLPRSKLAEQTAHRLAEIEFERFQLLQPLHQEKREHAIKKQRIEFEKSVQTVEKKKRDLAKLRIESPCDGIVYYGKSVDGKFGSSAEWAAKLKPKGVVPENEVFLSIVPLEGMSFRGTVGEADLEHCVVGTVASIAPAVQPHVRIAAKLQKVASIPSADGTFSVVLELTNSPGKKVVPGMTGKGRWVGYFNAKALTLPTRMVHQDPQEDDASFVYVALENGASEKRWGRSWNGLWRSDRDPPWTQWQRAHRRNGIRLEMKSFTWSLILGTFALCLVTSTRGLCQERNASIAESGPEPIAVDRPSLQEIETAIRRGVGFLAEHQNRDGSWGSATQTKDLNIYAPTPGAHHAFRAGTSALCVAALVDCRDFDPRCDGMIDRGEAWLLEHLTSLRRANQDAIYNVWGHAYGIEALVRLYHHRDGDPARQQEIRSEIEHQVALLGRYETTKGGWGYYDFHMHLQRPTAEPTSFTTATVLVALHGAREIGVTIPQGMIDRGIAVIQRQQRPDLAYLYSEDFRTMPGADVNKPGGSVGRSQACNYTLRLFGDESVSDDAMLVWAKRLYARKLWLDIGRKRPIPHESWFLVAGYFFYYGHYYAALGLDMIPAEQRGPLQDQLAHVLLKLQERDGSWWDYPLYDYHRPYGTGFALMSLVRCVREP